MLAKSDDHFKLAQMTIGRDAPVASDAMIITEADNQPMCEAVRRYLDCAVGIIDEADELLLFIYDPTFTASPGRRLMQLGEKRNASIVRAYEAVTGEETTKLQVFIVVGPSFADLPNGDENTFKETVGADMASVLSMVFPIGARGPIADFMPWLAQVAGSVILPGGLIPGDEPESDGLPLDAEQIAARAEKAVSQAWESFAINAFGVDDWNRTAQVEETFPAFVPLIRTVAKHSIDIASMLDTPQPRDLANGYVRMAVENAAMEYNVEIGRA